MRRMSPAVRTVLWLLADGEAWTVQDLAADAGMSRTSAVSALRVLRYGRLADEDVEGPGAWWSISWEGMQEAREGLRLAVRVLRALADGEASAIRLSAVSGASLGDVRDVLKTLRDAGLVRIGSLRDADAPAEIVRHPDTVSWCGLRVRRYDCIDLWSWCEEYTKPVPAVRGCAQRADGIWLAADLTCTPHWWRWCASAEECVRELMPEAESPPPVREPRRLVSLLRR